MQKDKDLRVACTWDRDCQGNGEGYELHPSAFKLVSYYCRRQHSMVSEGIGSRIPSLPLTDYITLGKLNSSVPQLPYLQRRG